MMNAIVQKDDAAVIESVVIGGDLSKLTPEQRVNYYRSVCHSLDINPLTRPFDYITLNGKLTLYARKDATDQLRGKHKISIDKPDIHYEDDWIIVTVGAEEVSTGRKDYDIGVVNRKDMQGAFGNALMKAVTKAKRRVTLSICGLGMLDETEIETIPNARPVTVIEETGEIIEGTNPEPITDEAWELWNELGNKAVKVGLPVPVFNRDEKTMAELREIYADLNVKVRSKNG